MNSKADEVSLQYQTIVLEKSKGVATLTLNRPRRFNAINTDMLRELQVAIEEVSQDDEVKVLVVTGAGAGFCTGVDIDMVRGMIESPSWEEMPLRERLRPVEPWYSVVLQLRGLAKPVIAAINGIAVGGGLVLALVADIRIASDRASFSQIFARRGLSDGASTYFLPKLVGVAKACEMAFTGKVIDAREAERIGLINQVVTHDELMETTRELAADIAKGPAIALQLAKQALHRGFTCTDLAAHIEYELNTVLISIATEDFKEGVRSFLEKREPIFRGR